MTIVLKTMWIISYLKHINKKLWLYDVYTDKDNKNDLHNSLFQFIEIPRVTYMTLQVYYALGMMFMIDYAPNKMLLLKAITSIK